MDFILQKQNKASVLLIGGSGVLSTAIRDLSVSEGYVTYVLNRGNRIHSINPNAIYLKADIRNAKEVENVLGDLEFDIVIDFLSFKVNELQGTLSLFEKKCKQFIFISSAAVYNKANQNGLFTEESLLSDPNWDYSINKVKCEKYLQVKCKSIGLIYTIIRPAITYGNTRVPYGIMPNYCSHWTFIARILSNKPILIWDEGINVTTITHVTDFAKGVVGLFGNPKSFNEAFHITTDNAYTWRSIAEIIGEILVKQPIIVDLPKEYIIEKRPFLRGLILGSRAKNTVFDNTKIKAAVPEFVCKIGIREGIAQTIEYYKTHDYLNGIDYFWDGQMDNLISEYYRKLSTFQFERRKLCFVNYLSDANLCDRIAYELGRSNYDFCMRIFNRLTNYYINKMKGY